VSCNTIGDRLVANLLCHHSAIIETARCASIAEDAGAPEMPHTRERLRRFLIRALSRLHGRVYRASGGRLLGRLAGMPVLLLTTIGRGSGEPRTAALTYFRDGADLVVIGSFGGSDLPPAWWLNLQRDPRASVLIGGTTSKVTARAATAEEHDRLWPLVTTTHPGYARYQERTARLIPIVMLTPDTE
jgi:F420H(2)-dependent quinone reductase